MARFEVCVEPVGSAICTRVTRAPTEFAHLIGQYVVASKARSALIALGKQIKAEVEPALPTLIVAHDPISPICAEDRTADWAGGEVRGFGRWARDVGSDREGRYQIVTRANGRWDVQWLIPESRLIWFRGQQVAEIVKYRALWIVSGNDTGLGPLDGCWQELVGRALMDLPTDRSVPGYGRSVLREPGRVSAVVGIRHGCRLLLNVFSNGAWSADQFVYRLTHDQSARRPVTMGVILRAKASGHGATVQGHDPLGCLRVTAYTHVTKAARTVLWQHLQPSLSDPFLFRPFDPNRDQALPLPIGRRVISLATMFVRGGPRKVTETLCLNLKVRLFPDDDWAVVSIDRSLEGQNAHDWKDRLEIILDRALARDLETQRNSRGRAGTTEGKVPPSKGYSFRFRVEPSSFHDTLAAIRALPVQLRELGIDEGDIALLLEPMPALEAGPFDPIETVHA